MSSEVLKLLNVATEWGGFRALANLSKNTPNAPYSDAYNKMFEIEKDPVEFLIALKEIEEIHESGNKIASYFQCIENYLKTGLYKEK